MRAREMTAPTVIATTGDLCREFSDANGDGKALMRPRAKLMRLDTFTPAFEFASVEFTIARKTSIQNSPYSVLATPSHELPVLPVLKVSNPRGPVATSIAYVVKT